MNNAEPTRPEPGKIGVSRRTAVAAVGLTALAAPVLAGCSTYRDTGEERPEPDKPDGKDKGQSLGTTSEIPAGGGKIFTDAKVVVTQPEEGTFKGFSAVCTHRGCTVREVVDGSMNCLCHGSKFAIADGSVVNGPATEPLPEMQVTVEGDTISLA